VIENVNEAQAAVLAPNFPIDTCTTLTQPCEKNEKLI
jgi:hypothetical protein